MSSKEHTWVYSSHYCTIPGAFIEITVKNSDQPGLISKAIFLIDTGAEINFIRKEVFEMLKLVFTGDDNVSLGGTVDITRNKSYLGIEIPELGIQEKLDVIVWEENENGDNVLGRQFLNKFLICFDGIKQGFTIHR